MSENFILAALVFLPMIAAVLSYLIGALNKTVRNFFVQAVVVMEAVAFICLLAGFDSEGMVARFDWYGFCGLGLHFTMDGFRVLYGSIAAFMWAMTGLFSGEYFAHYRNRNRYYLFYLITLGATVGVFLAADLYTLFVFFEIMSMASFLWVAQEESRDALRAGDTYLAVAVIGGLVMLMGLFLLYVLIGTLTIKDIKPAIALLDPSKKGLLYAAGGCMLFGFGAKAGMFPLQIWLPKAHPVAPAPASALLSGILTKAGIFGVLLLSGHMFFEDGVWGSVILTLGVITMFVGALLAVFSVNLKRTLACSSVSQIGFILVGIGMSCLLGEENALAVRGALLHMVNHSLIKLALFMAAGVVFMNLHELDLNKIRGFGRGKWFLNFVFLMGALGIGGIPLWNGYISKTLIHESIVEYMELLNEGITAAVWFGAGQMKIIEWIFLFSGGMTVAYMTKLYVALFVERNEDEKVQKRFEEMSGKYLSLKSKIALGLSAVLLPLMGFLPDRMMDWAADLGQSIMLLTESERVKYFSVANLKGAGISILIGGLLYFGVIRLFLMKADVTVTKKGKKQVRGERRYVDLWPRWMDLENLVYRPVLLKLLPFVFGVAARVLDSLVDWIVVFLRKTIYRDSPLPEELTEGTRFTKEFGHFLDHLTGNRTHEENKSYAHKLAVLREDMNENMFIVSRSMSFALMLFCLGLVITVAYLLFFKI